LGEILIILWIFLQNFIQKYELYIWVYFKGETKSEDENIESKSWRKILEWLKQKVDIFIETKNIFNPLHHFWSNGKIYLFKGKTKLMYIVKFVSFVYYRIDIYFYSFIIHHVFPSTQARTNSFKHGSLIWTCWCLWHQGSLGYW